MRRRAKRRGLCVRSPVSPCMVSLSSSVRTRKVSPLRRYRRPVSDRTQDVGCWILSNDLVGELTGTQTFWHLDTFATRNAAEAAKTKRSTVVQALGRTWLLTIEDATWHAPGGEHVTTIGPLPIAPGTYAAQYMEAVFNPGMTAPVHTHSCPEAWYTTAGETCLETPEGKQVGALEVPRSLSPAAHQCI
jgi:hypothetical protein